MTAAAKLDPVARRKRALVLKLRRDVKVHRRFSIEDMGDGREKQTCQTCGASILYRHSTYNNVVRRLIAYRAHGGGLHGVCPACSKVRALERYPMPAHLEL